MKSYINYVLINFVVLLLLFLGAIEQQYQLRLLFLISAGLLSGFYNGYYNDVQWRPQSPRHRNYTEGSPESLLPNKHIDVPYNVNKMFNHLVCGLVASFCLFLLLSKLNFTRPLFTISQLTITDFFLFTISVTGFTGILPRAIWYWSYGPRLNK